MEEVIESGKIEELIENKIEKSLETAIEKYFDSWGDFQKDLNETLKEKMKINLNDMEIPAYNKLILDFIEKEVNNTLSTVGVEKVKNNLKELLASAPKEIKLQEIIDKYIEEKDDEIHEDFIEYIYFDYKHSSIKGYVDIIINLHELGKYDSPDLNFTLREIEEDKYEIFRVDIKGASLKDFDFIGSLYGIERFMFNLYAAGSVVVNDPEGFDYLNTCTGLY
ncbi:hypothetical protein [Orenia marismortui]|uniref:hypothetical protein n=1 Tax=Orenia marismortui TaxID=46469 RepID=UPI0003625EA3|nr:hypothetical protein [Orenia marismortui]